MRVRAMTYDDGGIDEMGEEEEENLTYSCV